MQFPSVFHQTEFSEGVLTQIKVNQTSGRRVKNPLHVVILIDPQHLAQAFNHLLLRMIAEVVPVLVFPVGVIHQCGTSGNNYVVLVPDDVTVSDSHGTPYLLLLLYA